MAYYRFDSEWKLTAPIEQVFDLLSHPEGFSQWWPSLTRSVLTQEGGDDGVGTRVELTVRAPLLYSTTLTATVVEVERLHRIHVLIRGGLVGTGTLEVAGNDSFTDVRFVWRVSTTRRWVNTLAPMARSLFARTQYHVISEGAEAMAERLGARLISSTTRFEGEPHPHRTVEASS